MFGVMTHKWKEKSVLSVAEEVVLCVESSQSGRSKSGFRLGQLAALWSVPHGSRPHRRTFCCVRVGNQNH